MASQAFAGVGTTLSCSLGIIGEVRTISGPGLNRETADVTSLDSTAGYREFITTFRDGGEMTFDVNFTLAGYSLMYQLFLQNSKSIFAILLPDAPTSQIAFSGFVTQIPLDVNPDSAVSFTTTVKATGAVTVTT